MLAKCTNSCWKPLRPPVVTVPILKSTTRGPGTLDSTATIVRLRILIWTFAFCCDVELVDLAGRLGDDASDPFALQGCRPARAP